MKTPGLPPRLLLLLNVAACDRQKPTDADLVLTDARVYTMDLAGTTAQAVGVRGGEIVLVGSAEEAAAITGPETTVVDLDGAPLLPGFIDAHTHLAWSGTQLLDADLYAATSLDELVEIIQATAEARPDEPWVRGVGWDASLFEGMLDAALLDLAVPDRPAYMESADGHSAWVNTLALEEAGITAYTPDPEGGIIERDASGEATGILREDATSLVADLMPAWSEAQVDEGLATALAEANSFGLTTFIDPACEDWMLEGYQRAADAGTLSGRVRCAVVVDPLQGAEQLDAANALRARYTDERVQVNAAKFYIDGVLESQTAYLLEPYTDGSNGEPAFDYASLTDLLAAFDGEGYQIHAHAIGDAGVRQILDGLEVLARVHGEEDRRPLLAHIQLIHPDDRPRFAALGAFADLQALWAYPDPYITELTLPVIGEARAPWLYPFGDLATAGAVLVAGSDWSVSSMNPWEAIEVGVTRRDPSDPSGETLNPSQALSLEQLLVAYTRDGAKAAFLEDQVGTIAVGLRADLVVLDRDLFELEQSALSEVSVTRTWVEGVQVYPAE